MKEAEGNHGWYKYSLARVVNVTMSLYPVI